MIQKKKQFFFYLKNAGRPKRIGHNTCKSMETVLCVVRSGHPK